MFIVDACSVALLFVFVSGVFVVVAVAVEKQRINGAFLKLPKYNGEQCNVFKVSKHQFNCSILIEFAML